MRLLLPVFTDRLSGSNDDDVSGMLPIFLDNLRFNKNVVVVCFQKIIQDSLSVYFVDAILLVLFNDLSR